MRTPSEDWAVSVPDGDDAERLRELLPRIARAVSDRGETGRVADYIPALARVDPGHFGLAVARLDGSVATLGDAHQPFSIQSVSKVFMLALALGKRGNDLWKRVGREPSGTPFNSIVQLERENGVPRNPFINAGAIVVADVVLDGRGTGEAVGELVSLLGGLCGEPVTVDAEVAASEARTGERNRALAHFMRGYGNLEHAVEDVLDAYFHQCAVAMSCVQLARSALFLAADGVNPLDGSRVVRAARARRINAVMVTCGHYDASGDFAFRVGLPGKSGVGGGIVVVAPGRGAACAWAPGLDANGNSLLGAVALELLADELGWSVFG